MQLNPEPVPLPFSAYSRHNVTAHSNYIMLYGFKEEIVFFFPYIHVLKKMTKHHEKFKIELFLNLLSHCSIFGNTDPKIAHKVFWLH